MSKVLWVIAFLGLVACIGYAVNEYRQQPTTFYVSIPNTKPVMETKTVEIPKLIRRPDGSYERSTIIATYNLGAVIHETSEASIEVDRQADLAFYATSVVVVFFAFFMLCVLIQWMWLFFTATAKDPRWEKIDHYMHYTIGFAFGTIMGVIGGTHLHTTPPNTAAMELKAVNETNEQLQNLLTTSQDQLRDLAQKLNEANEPTPQPSPFKLSLMAASEEL